MDANDHAMKKARILIPAAFLVFASACAVRGVRVPPAPEASPAPLLARLPSADAADRDAVCAKILRLGPAALEGVCARVLPPGAGDDSAARYALDGLAVYVTRAGGEAERALFARAVAAALVRPADKEVKAFLISELQRAGGRESIKPLAAYLLDERLSGPAARALVSIGGPESAWALLAALDKAKGAAKLAVVQALGEIGSREAVRKILPLAESSDPELRRAVLAALARIGDPAAGPALAKARVAASRYERGEAASLYLLYARRLVETGKAAEGLAVARDMLAGYASPGESQVAANALSLIVSTLAEKALPDLLAAADSSDVKLRAAALELTRRLPGAQVTAKWCEKSAAAPPEVRADIVVMLGNRKDPSALPAVRAALADGDKSVRLAAIPAAAALGGETVLPDLFAFFEKDDEEEVAAAQTALLGFGRDAVVPEAVRRMDGASVSGRAALIDVLAAKGAMDRFDLVFGLAQSEEAPVRSAAIRALPALAKEKEIPRLADLLFAASDSADVVSLQEAVAAAANRIPAREERADPVLKIMASAQAPQKTALLRVLPRIGGTKALRAVVEETGSTDPRVRAVAVYALSQWPDYSASTDLLRIIGTTDDRKQRLLALDGYVRLVGSSGFPDWKKLDLLTAVLALPKDDADKKAVVAGIAGVRGPGLFRILGRLIDNPVLGPAAVQALLDTASEQAPEERWLAGQEAVSVLRRVEASAPDAADRERAAALAAERLKQGGFVPLFNGRDLAGWKGLVTDPPKRAAMTADELAKAQAAADEVMRAHWRVENGVLVFDGKGESLCTVKDYADFEMLVDWKIEKGGDSGIYLRGSPQVQIWDPAANPVGSGGLYNNQKGASKPLEAADRPVGEWNTFRIIMIGDRVTVYLNDTMVVNNTVLENYWERDKPIYPVGQLELQAHGNVLYFKNIYVREIPRDAPPAAGSVPDAVSDSEKDEGFALLFNGLGLTGWTGDAKGYVAENGKIVVHPDLGGGNLYTEKEYGDFVLRFEFKLTPAANNGIGIRAPLEGDAAYAGMEIQVLEDGSPVYWTLQPYQYHGSVYGVVPARRGVLRPVGEWNTEEITADGRRVRVVVNGTTVVDADLDQASAGGPIDHRDHPGLARRTGHIGFLGHGSIVEFRNIRIRELKTDQRRG
jgi:HEAT repeat protein